jgi:hypothetical protein
MAFKMKSEMCRDDPQRFKSLRRRKYQVLLFLIQGIGARPIGLRRR